MYAIEEMTPAHRPMKTKLIGEDNDPIGFNDQSANFPPSSTSAKSSNPTQTQ